jgi:hypothetical protein
MHPARSPASTTAAVDDDCDCAALFEELLDWPAVDELEPFPLSRDPEPPHPVATEAPTSSV